MLERDFQASLIKEIKKIFPKCMVIKNDPDYIQGIPDLIILNGTRWAALEVKRSIDAPHRPNQDFYISKMNEMSYASFVCPENKEDILDELQQALQSRRATRISRG